jgi:fatty acid synthase subunit beta, fungi type
MDYPALDTTPPNMDIPTPSMKYSTPSTAGGDSDLYPQTTFSLIYKTLTYTTPLLSNHAVELSQHKPAFISLLDSSSSESNSIESLLLRFFQFLLDRQVSAVFITPLVSAFQKDFLILNEIHSVIASLPESKEAQRSLLRTYYTTLLACGQSIEAHNGHSALFKESERDSVKLVALFGGQGASNPRCFKELLDLYETYSPLLETLITTIDNVLYELCVSPDTYDFFRGREIRLLSWLQNPEAVPSDQFLASAPVSFPIHGLVALAHWFVVCKLLGRTPGDIRSLLGGATGHSQGIIIGAAVSASESWASFYENAILATKLLFWTGYESHNAAPRVALTSAAVEESKSHGEGQPSSMLFVSGLSSPEIVPLLAKCNEGLPADRNIYPALSNAKYSHTIAGAASSLLRFTKLVREIGVGRDVDQSRLPFDKRKPVVETQFLPISAPFHTPYLAEAGTRIKSRLSNSSLDVKQLAIPVYDTRDGSNLAATVKGDLVPYLVDALTVQPVDWVATLSSSRYTHVLAFGKTVADMVATNVTGKGVQIISATELTTSNPQFGSKRDLFSPHLSESFLSPRSWEEEFQPRLVRSDNGSVKIQTKLSKLLDMPPIMVAGMTPTTVPWDFVSACINAGYHAELAGGGYFNAETMTAAINKLIDSVKPGQGITCNLIYASPQAMQWQIAMLRRLARNGQPIDGLTIGAGVPSLDVVKEWITTLGLRHISFKPGSEDAIERVLEIAKAHPDFPIIIQWTGGRGGGHHSYEDFHAPILRLYGKIRQSPNAVLVAGSGFGDGEGSYPYLTGSWSVKYGYAKMPFDGILVGSRVMAAKEAHTSLSVKQLICDIPGTHDGKWTDSYKRPVGGIVTVQSEMGQPIHKIASRGVLFWKEMDETIFSLPRAKQLEAIQKRKAYIIRKLNDDFAKPWFGQNSKGEAVELTDMTYLEIISRLINLVYLPQSSRWIDPSYAGLVGDVAVRSLERLGVFSEIDTSKPEQIKEIFSRKFPQAKETIIHPEDASWFLERCRRRGQKPTNFVPVLDENFSTWLKKDSLWQSENIESVIDQDPGRICILHGPVAAQYSQQVDEPVGEILGGINDSWIKLLTGEFYESKEVPVEEPSETFFALNPATINVVENDQRTTVRLSTTGALPTHEEVLQYLASRTEGWMRSIFLSDSILQGRTKRSNFFRESFQLDVDKSVDIDRANSKIILEAIQGEKRKTLVSLSSADGVSINAQVIHHIPVSDIPVPLHFKFRYDRNNTLFPLSEELQDRDLQIKSFYSRLWLGSEVKNSLGLYSTFGGYRTVLSPEVLHQWTNSVGLSHTNDRLVSADTGAFPLNATIIPAWEALVQPLMVPEIDGDLLRLVHLSIEFQLLSGSKPLQIGETVEVTSTIESIIIDDPGKVVTVRAVISRDNQPAVAIISKFLIRGSFPDFTGTFQRSTQPDMLLTVSSSIDNAVLRSRPWLKLDNEDVNLVGETLLFRLLSFSTYKSEKVFGTLRTTGEVFIQHPRQGLRAIGHVNFDATDAYGNPVVDFLTRKGTLAVERHALENPGWSGPSTQTLKMPFEMEVYARVSKDYNPIHVSPVFAAVANLPGTIVHGMYTSAVASAALDQVSNDFNHLRTQRYTVSFVDMVLPGEEVRFKYRHVAMLKGKLVVQIQAFKVTTGDRVLEGEAELEQVPTAYVFTGQGSQFQGMGMDLYNSSAVARKIWDDIDRYLLNSYGETQLPA